MVKIPFLEEIDIDVDAIIDEAKELASKAVDFLKDVAISAAQKAVALVKETALGTAILNLVSAASHIDDKEMSGIEKFNAIFDRVIDAYRAFSDNGGFRGLISTGLNILRQVIQSIYDDFKNAFLQGA